MQYEKISLEGQHVLLEPLSKAHEQGIIEAVKDGKLWTLFVTMVPHLDQIEKFIYQAEKAHSAGDGLTFATIDKKNQKVVGSTRFMKASPPNKRVEIGFTFLAKSVQKTAINTEAKLLMLTHAFETLKLNRVELVTDYLNDNSRRAIMRLGAKMEGVMRNHMVMPNGRIRDSVIYSVIENEWDGVKQNLMNKLR